MARSCSASTTPSRALGWVQRACRVQSAARESSSSCPDDVIQLGRGEGGREEEEGEGGREGGSERGGGGEGRGGRE